MISTFKFGNHGRLGNQLFQYSFLFGLNKKHGYQIGLIKNNCQFWNCFELPKGVTQYTNHNFQKTVYEKNGACNYDESLTNHPDNTVFVGYFQSYKYFDDFKKELIESLIFKSSVIDDGEKEFKKYGNDCVSIHIRRGDYIDRPDLWGDLVKENYFKKCLEFIPKNKNILVFSDDPIFAENYFNKLNVSVNIIKQNEFVSLYMMTKCNYHVISNSSFSWMGAYLSNSDYIICPDQWWPITHPFPNNVQRDITKSNWIKLKIF
jgi:hypothetical protein